MNELASSNPFNHKTPLPTNPAARDKEVMRRSNAKFYAIFALLAVIVGVTVVVMVTQKHKCGADQYANRVASGTSQSCQ